MPKDYTSLKNKISAALASPERGKTLLVAVKRGRDARKAQLATLEDPQGFREEIKELKTRSTANLDELVKVFAETCEKNGNKVFLAKNGQDVVDYILKLAVVHNATLIEKSKSLTTEEIELNHHLQEGKKDLEVVETDLGERIIQLVDEKPYHLVFPAIHKTQTEVAEIFSNVTKTQIPDDLQAIMAAVRKHLRPTFLNSQMGITGANIAVAETGSIIVETNEGNARLVSAIPDLHVVVLGMEKIVATWEEAMKLVMAHPISATGTRLTNYVSVVTHRLPYTPGVSRELHVVILDNGRTKMRKDPWFREGLNCIRCGACMNACPTYGVVGGHTFGYIYPGPIGIPWTEEVHGLEKAEFAHLCISCGLCKEICPVEIDIPMMIAKVKEKDVEKYGQLRANKILSRSDDFAKMASSTAPLSNWVIQSSLSRYFMDRFLGIERKRKIPRFYRRTFEKRFSSIKQQVPNPKRKIVYFVDLVANFSEPELGVRAARLLQQSGFEVIVPPKLKSSGMPYISYGELGKAKQIAEWNVKLLAPYVSEGYDVVATEPTATYCLKFAYPKLLDNSKESLAVAEKSFEYFEYLNKFSEPPVELRRKDLGANDNSTLGFHIPCHQRALSEGKYTIAFLERAGYKVRVLETGTCCGMAGTFGLKKGPLGYDLSMAVGKPLFDLFNGDKSIKIIATESSVCTTQLEDGTHSQLMHPLNLVSF